MVRGTPKPGAVEGFHLVALDWRDDSRGSFLPLVNSQLRHITDVVDINISRSHRGVARGMHINVVAPQAKVVKVIQGSIIDVFIDLRPKSKTFLNYSAIAMNPKSMALYLPRGVAHGFFAEEDTILAYATDAPYQPKGDYGVSIHTVEPLLGSRLRSAIMSSKDKSLPTVDAFFQIPEYSQFIWNKS